MANKKVFTLEIDGVEKAIRNITVLQKEQAELEKELKDLTKGTEAYTLSQIALSRNTKELAGATDNYNKELEDTEENTKDANKETGSFTDSLESLGGTMAGNVAGAFRGMSKGIKAATFGFKGLKAAIAATGIGLLILAITALVAFFTKTQKGADLLSNAMAGLGAVMDLLVDAFSTAGEALFNALDNPKKAWESFKDALESGFEFLNKAVIKPFLAFWKISWLQIVLGFKTALAASKEFFGLDASELREEIKGINDEIKEQQKIIVDGVKLIVEAVTDGVNAVKKIIDETADAANKAIALNDRINKLRDAEIGFIVRRAKLQRGIEADRLKAEQEEQFTVQERIKALEAAERKQDEITAKDISFAKERAAITEGQLKLSKNLAEDERKLEEQKARVIELEGERDRRVKRLVTRLAELRNQEKAQERARIKALEDIAKAEDKAEQALIQSRITRNANQLKEQEAQIGKRLELGEASIKDFAAIARKRADAEILVEITKNSILLENTKLTADDRTKIAEEEAEKIRIINSKLQDDLTAKEKTEADKRDEDRKAGIEAIKEAGKQLFAALTDFIDVLFEKSIEDKEKRLAESQETLSAAEKGLEESKSKAEGIQAELAASSGRRREFLLKQLEEEESKTKNLEKAKSKAAADDIKRSKELEKEKKRAAKLEAAITIGQAVAGGAKAVINALASLPFPASFIAAGITAATTALQIATVVKSLGSFAGGGRTPKGQGQPDETGFRPVGIVHEDEYVVPKKILFSNEGSMLVNRLEGMRTGGSFAEGGFTTPNFSNVAEQVSSDPVTEEIRLLRAETAQIKNLEFVVNAREVTDVSDNVAKIEEGASI